MTDVQKSYQQLDPVGGMGTRTLTVAGAAVLGAYALIGTVATWAQVSQPLFALLALAAIAVSVVGLVHWSNPLRAPFSTAGFTTVAGFAVVAMVLQAVGSWHTNTGFRDDWGGIAAGYVLLQLAPYRPPRQLAGFVVLAAIIRGFLALLESRAMHETTPPVVSIVTATAPMLALSLAGVAAASVIVDSLNRWHQRALLAASEFTDELRSGIERSVQQDRVTILNRDVVPFFAEVVRTGSVTPDDRARAGAIADSIRSVMLADIDRSWLDEVVDRAARTHSDSVWPGSEVVQDDRRLAAAMNTEQRTAVRALIVALFDRGGFDPDGFGILITRGAIGAEVQLTAKLDASDSVVRSELAPYFAVLQVVFRGVHVDFQPPTLALKFSYDQ